MRKSFNWKCEQVLFGARCDILLKCIEIKVNSKPQVSLHRLPSMFVLSQTLHVNHVIKMYKEIVCFFKQCQKKKDSTQNEQNKDNNSDLQSYHGNANPRRDT